MLQYMMTRLCFVKTLLTGSRLVCIWEIRKSVLLYLAKREVEKRTSLNILSFAKVGDIDKLNNVIIAMNGV